MVNSIASPNFVDASQAKELYAKHLLAVSAYVYRIYSNKRRGAYLIFRATSAALIWGRRLFD